MMGLRLEIYLIVKAFADTSDVLLAVVPSPGQGLIFDHVILHDGEEVTALSEGARKVIIRMDVVLRTMSVAANQFIKLPKYSKGKTSFSLLGISENHPNLSVRRSLF